MVRKIVSKKERKMMRIDLYRQSNEREREKKRSSSVLQNITFDSHFIREREISY